MHYPQAIALSIGLQTMQRGACVFMLDRVPLAECGRHKDKRQAGLKGPRQAQMANSWGSTGPQTFCSFIVSFKKGNKPNDPLDRNTHPLQLVFLPVIDV